MSGDTPRSFSAQGMWVARMRREREQIMAIRTEKELAEALNRSDDVIEIEGDLANKIIRIKATGRIAWAIALGAIAMALVCGVAAVISGPAAPLSATGVAVGGTVAVGGLGSATWTAVAIAAAAGGVGALKRLRKYRITKQDQNGIVLEK